MHLKVPRLYDSHTHWLGTGQIASGLQLFHLKSASEIRSLKIQPSHFRADWLVGFGWNSQDWAEEQMPTKELINEVFPDFPVFLSKSDGHGSWLNSIALKYLGFPTEHPGLLLEEDHFKAYSALPAYSDAQVQEALRQATEIFNRAGFTHIRDMTCDQQQWQQALQLEASGKLSLYVDVNFLCESPEYFESALRLTLEAKASQTKHLRVQGIKLFYDGTLGSETAMLSNCPCNKDRTFETKFAWNLENLEEVIMKTWSAGLEISVHTIGDEAVHQVVATARKVMATNKYTGWLNLEHVQVLRPETLQMMKALHVRCYMQPCHWLSDRVWLKEKLGDLYKHAFPWGTLSKSGIPLFFGSDSPVAKSSFWDNEQALRESTKAKIPAIKGSIVDYHSHPVRTSDETYTVFEGQQLKQVIFDGREIHLS